MTGRSIALATAALGAAVVVACGPSASIAPIGTSGAVTTPAPPASTFDIPSFALPSLPSEDADLEALLPDEVGGRDVVKTSLAGETFLGSPGSGTDEFKALLELFDKGPSDLSVAYGSAGVVTVVAYRIKGLPASQAYEAYLRLAQASEGSVATDATLGGKSVKKVESGGSVVYVYGSEDVLFSVFGDGVSAELLNETFSKLP